MKRLTTAIVMILCLSMPAQAEIYDPFITQLRDQGYGEITVGRTWLGRIVINAQRADIAREIVLNARTGEILGDQANLIGGPVAPRVSQDDNDDDDDAPRVAVTTVEPDPITATIVEQGDALDTKAILDTGTKTTVGD